MSGDSSVLTQLSEREVRFSDMVKFPCGDQPFPGDKNSMHAKQDTDSQALLHSVQVGRMELS